MASKKISELTEVTSPIATDVFPIVNGGETKKVQLTNIKSILGVTQAETNQGTLSSLTTTVKTNLVGAINELDSNSVIVSATEPTGDDRKKNWFEYGVGVDNPKMWVLNDNDVYELFMEKLKDNETIPYSTNSNISYRKINGFLEVRSHYTPAGLSINNLETITLGTLPEGYRPKTSVIKLCYSIAVGGALISGFSIIFYLDGTVLLDNRSGGAINLYNIDFMELIPLNGFE